MRLCVGFGFGGAVGGAEGLMVFGSCGWGGGEGDVDVGDVNAVVFLWWGGGGVEDGVASS